MERNNSITEEGECPYCGGNGFSRRETAVVDYKWDKEDSRFTLIEYLLDDWEDASEFPYICDGCDAEFNQEGNLIKHDNTRE